MEEKIKQLELDVAVLKSKNNMLMNELKKINSKLNAVGSKEIGTGCTIHFNKEAFEKFTPDLLHQLILQQSDL